MSPPRPPQRRWLLTHSDLESRQILFDADASGARALSRGWALIQAADTLWAALPTPLGPTEPGIAQIEAIAAGLHRSQAKAGWPGPGEVDPRLTNITNDLTRATDLVTRLARVDQPLRPEAARDVAAARTRLMHTVYLATHGVGVALRAYCAQMTTCSPTATRPVGGSCTMPVARSSARPTREPRRRLPRRPLAHCPRRGTPGPTGADQAPSGPGRVGPAGPPHSGPHPHDREPALHRPRPAPPRPGHPTRHARGRRHRRHRRRPVPQPPATSTRRRRILLVPPGRAAAAATAHPNDESTRPCCSPAARPEPRSATSPTTAPARSHRHTWPRPPT